MELECLSLSTARRITWRDDPDPRDPHDPRDPRRDPRDPNDPRGLGWEARPALCDAHTAHAHAHDQAVMPRRAATQAQRRQGWVKGSVFHVFKTSW